MPDTPTRTQIEREIAEGLDRLADIAFAHARPDDATDMRRHDALIYRLIADHVRAGLYLEEKARG